jgi:hypothetical protein
MSDGLAIVIIFVAWLIITKFLFPKMGVPT